MEIAAYLRVSTADQQTANQLLAITKHCEAQGMTLGKIYQDQGISGAKHSRPALDELKADIESGKVKGLIVYRLDRLARSTSHLIEMLEILKDKEIKFISDWSIQDIA
ncbi:MAG: recombinase family protein [Lentisphaeria bacterium]|nr:recombinase family protein [Lentisphaeria bacterium]NQY67294.1 recombinase family protein [Flavobacteriales bacterium]